MGSTRLQFLWLLIISYRVQSGILATFPPVRNEILAEILYRILYEMIRNHRIFSRVEAFSRPVPFLVQRMWRTRIITYPQFLSHPLESRPVPFLVQRMWRTKRHHCDKLYLYHCDMYHLRVNCYYTIVKCTNYHKNCILNTATCTNYA